MSGEGGGGGGGGGGGDERILAQIIIFGFQLFCPRGILRYSVLRSE
jgi:hypothetical protein